MHGRIRQDAMYTVNDHSLEADLGTHTGWHLVNTAVDVGNISKRSLGHMSCHKGKASVRHKEASRIGGVNRSFSLVACHTCLNIEPRRLLRPLVGEDCTPPPPHVIHPICHSCRCLNATA